MLNRVTRLPGCHRMCLLVVFRCEVVRCGGRQRTPRLLISARSCWKEREEPCGFDMEGTVHVQRYLTGTRGRSHCAHVRGAVGCGNGCGVGERGPCKHPILKSFVSVLGPSRFWDLRPKTLSERFSVSSNPRPRRGTAFPRS